MSKRFSITINDGLYETLSSKAQELGLTPNKYTAMLLVENLQPNPGQVTDTSDIENTIMATGRRRNYTLDLADASILRRKAQNLGLNDTAYLRILIRTKTFKLIDYTVDDLFAYLSQLQKAIDSILAFVELIRKDGKGVVFAPDVQHMTELAEQLKSLMLAQVDQAFKTRSAVYDNMIKKIEDSL